MQKLVSTASQTREVVGVGVGREIVEPAPHLIDYTKKRRVKWQSLKILDNFRDHFLV